MHIQVRHAIAALSCALALALPCAAFAATAAAGKATDKADTQAQQAANKAEQQDEAQAAGPSDELLAWADETDCTSCHEVPAKSLDDETCAASLHTALGLGCTDCHADEKGLAKGHKKAKEGVAQVKRLKKSEVDGEICLTCHKQEDLAKATAEQDVLADKEGTVVNPHDLPAVEEHQGVSCASCHYMHREKPALETAPAVCDGCHHDGVYKCFTCHA